jgi:hypothetical protein
MNIGGGGISVQTQRTLDLNASITTGDATWTANGSAIINYNGMVTGSVSLPRNLTLAGGGTHNINSIFNLNGGDLLASGTLRLGGNNFINANITGLNTFDLNGFSESLGTLTKNGGMVIDFSAAAGANSLSFADSSALTWNPAGWLTIANFESGVDSLRFGTTASGLTPTQLGLIRFDLGGNNFIDGAVMDGSGFISPVPEPHTFALIFGFLAFALVAFKRTRPIPGVV